jgi:hypothetical protein
MNGGNLQTLVERLYETRTAAAAARKLRAVTRAEVGDCTHRDQPAEGPCWMHNPETWCDACSRVKPYYEAYHKAADRAGAALRLVLREGKRLAYGVRP